MKTTAEILGKENFEKLKSEFTLYNYTIKSVRTGELTFSQWLKIKHKPQFEILKLGLIADIKEQRIKWEK
jgi:hypothetical protein